MLRYQRNYVVNRRAAPGHCLCHRWNVFLVHFGNEHGVHLYCHSGGGDFFYSAQLVLYQNPRGLDALKLFSAVDDELVYLGLNLRIDGVDGHGERVDSSVDYFVRLLRKKQAVCAHALYHGRKLVAHFAKGFQREVCGQRVAGTGNAYNRQVGRKRHRAANRFYRFVGAYYAAGHAGPLFGVVKVALAKAAADVAAGAYGQVNAALVGLLSQREAGMLFSYFFKCLGH